MSIQTGKQVLILIAASFPNKMMCYLSQILELTGFTTMPLIQLKWYGRNKNHWNYKAQGLELFAEEDLVQNYFICLVNLITQSEYSATKEMGLRMLLLTNFHKMSQTFCHKSSISTVRSMLDSGEIIRSWFWTRKKTNCSKTVLLK